ncbi:CIA30 family protein [Rubrivirga sp. IMCC43871]|uniref:CIA30 family protein n=1 Tax=Rubrivirga sp. IMCC43871 TaxID=3391575 RepID=UPI00398FBB5F
MHLSLLLLSVALAACSGTPPEAPAQAAADAPPTLFEFESDTEARWRVVNDGVMGGRSKGFLEVTDGTLAFTGDLVTAGGGFTSARVEHGADLSAFDGVELRVRGGGRTFEFEVNDATRRGRREVSRRAPFDTADDWKTVRIPFADLDATVFGEPVEVAPLDRAAVESFGLFIADGIDGPFRIEVDWIRAYRDDA